MMTLINQVRELWESSKDPQEWGDETTPSDDLIWKTGHPSQLKDLYSIGHLLNLPVRVAGAHRSKSVGLPVGIFRADVWTEEEVFMLTRDNFHDLKIVVVSTCPIDHLPYSVAHQHWSQETYYEQKRRSFEYCRPKPEKNLSGSHNWNEADYESDAWYSKWSGGTLLRHEGEIYRAGSTSPCYYEGIQTLLPKETFVRYEHGRQSFAVEVPGDVIDLMSIMRAVVGSARQFVQARRNRQHDLECLGRYRESVANGKEFLNDYHRGKYEELVKKYG